MAETPSQQGTSANTKVKKPRSAAYPGHDLETSIGFTKDMRDKLGNGPYSRDLAAQALGHPSINGTASAKIAACVHFGLLAREGNTYSQSEIADMILTPQTDEEKTRGIKLAVNSPTLYSKLISEYDNSALPTMLGNILVRTYKLTEKAAGDAATIFKKSVEFAGILVNGVIKNDNTSDSPSSSNEVDQNDSETVTNNNGSTQSPKQPTTPTGYLTVVIPGTDVRVLFPPEHAYELSIGTYGTAIKSLAEAVAPIEQKVVNSDDQSSNPTEA